jgi:hypothetical protein
MQFDPGTSGGRLVLGKRDGDRRWVAVVRGHGVGPDHEHASPFHFAIRTQT